METTITNYIPISRKLFDHPFWNEERPFSKFEAWLDILQSARYEDGKQIIGNQFIIVKRSQLPISLRYLSVRWGWSIKRTSLFLDCLVRGDMITKETSEKTGQTIITLTNYDKYNYTTEKKKHPENKNNIGNDNTDPHTTIPENENEAYTNFKKWLSEHCPNVLEIDKQLTEQEFLTMKTNYTAELMMETLLQLENRKDLIQKYTSLNFTLQNWLKISYNNLK